MSENIECNEIKYGFEEQFLPPLSDIVQLKKKMNKGNYKGVILNSMYFFDSADIDASKITHEIKELQNHVKEETQWFNTLKNNIKCPPEFRFSSMEKLEQFHEVLLNGRDQVCANSDNNRLLTSDLGLVAGKRWLNLELIKHFLDLRNRDLDDEVCIAFSGLEDMHKGSILGEQIRQWSDSGVSKICVVANVGRKQGRTYFATGTTPGNHWVCFQINFSTKEVIYCDSLVWWPPKEFLSDIAFITHHIDTFSPATSPYSIELAHKNQEPPRKVHRCTKGCLQLPYQGPNMSICGVASLITAILITEKGIDLSQSTNEMKWLPRIYEFNNFSRCLLIKWFMDNKIIAKDIWSTYEVMIWYWYFLTFQNR